MPDRPYLNYLTKQLIEEVELQRSDKRKLRFLINEIGFRKKAKTKLEPTLAKAQKYLSELNLVATSEDETSKIAEQKDIREVNHFSKDFSFQQNVLPVSNDLLRINGKIDQGFLASIFGFSPINFESDGKIITLSQSNLSVRITQASFFSACLFGYSLQEKLHSPNIKITKSTLNQLINTIEEAIISQSTDSIKESWRKFLSIGFYINHRRVVDWESSLGGASQLIKLLLASNKISLKNSELVKIFKDQKKDITEANVFFIKKAKEEYKDFFNMVEKNPLTEKQREAVIRDADACLVNAGAGTGKTSTVIGKIGYLLLTKTVKKDEILALAFGSDAAQEMRERVDQLLKVKVEVRTFHSLGMDILFKSKEKKLKISDSAKYDRQFLALVARLLKDVIETPKGGELFSKFISKHRYPAKFLEDFDSNGEYLEYMRKTEPYTLRGETVKSFEELLIADWLTLNGINYEYEKPYEVQTGSKSRNQYRPDFFLNDYSIYLEHFGIAEDGSTAPGIDSVRYNQDIQWKRELHEKHGTKLLETYSWQRMNGTLLESLETILKENDVSITNYSPDAIMELLEVNNLDKTVISLLKDFLTVFKENQYSIKELENVIDSMSADKDRFSCFLQLFELIYESYENYLHERQEIDFADLIKKATEIVESESYKSPFSRIIVDEYQDISRGRYNFIRALISKNDESRIFCVGDDWQSIYGFTGSDIKKTTSFESNFEGSEIVALDKTFRYHSIIQDFSAEFIQKNPNQLQKIITSDIEATKDPIKLYSYGSDHEKNNKLLECLDDIESLVPRGKRWNVFLLGRYKFLEPKNIIDLKSSYKKLVIDFKTIHGSKGLEAEAIILLDLNGGKYGFPSQIENDPILNLVRPGELEMPFSEERRVFYVAITRAKKFVGILSSKSLVSHFRAEIARSQHMITDDLSASLPQVICPLCNKGKLVNKYPNRKKGYAWACSLSPYCEGVAKYCPDCAEAPKIEGKPCVNIECPSNRTNT